MRTLRVNIVLIIIILIICGCFGKSQKIVTQKENDKTKARVIAIVPVENKSSDIKAAQLLRSRLLEELYFKGYPKLSLDKVDKTVELAYKKLTDKNDNAIARESLKETLGADAALYCTLTENNKTKIFYAPIKINVSCELKSTETGEVLWKTEVESVKRNFDLTNKGLEKKSYEDFESVIDDAVTKIIKTLPDGPNLSI